MPKITYIEKNLTESTLEIIAIANRIIEDYMADGMDLTLRQLYYQFVAHDHFPTDRCWAQDARGNWVKDPSGTKNAEPNYKWLGGIIADGRLAGKIDWNAIDDRARNLKQYYHNENPQDAIQDALRQYTLDKWVEQPQYVEVWIEKEALTGVIAGICRKLDVPYFACKGYSSLSEMWRAAKRFEYRSNTYEQTPVIIHLGDHDPSGIDMTRDIIDRLEMFLSKSNMALDLEVTRIALNMEQVNMYNPPPNPSKLSDSRAKSYIAKYGIHSWELDALEPRVMRDLIADTVARYTNSDIKKETEDRENRDITKLKGVIDNLNLD